MPWIEFDVQAEISDFGAVAFVDHAAEIIPHAQLSVIENRYRKSDSCLRRNFGQIHDDEMARTLMDPAPGHEVEVALIVGPSSPFAEFPLPTFEIIPSKDLKQLHVELLKANIGRLFRTTPQEYREFDPASFELAVMEQRRALQGRNRDGCRPRL